jgi:hypothetical protein
MITITNQIRYQRNRLRKNKREKTILNSLLVWESHFGENQSNTMCVIGMDHSILKQFQEFITLKYQ